MLGVRSLTDRSVGKKLGETNHAPTTLVEESSDDESEQYELNCEPERQPGPQNDHSEESVSEDIAWESATVSDKGEREDG